MNITCRSKLQEHFIWLLSKVIWSHKPSISSSHWQNSLLTLWFYTEVVWNDTAEPWIRLKWYCLTPADQGKADRGILRGVCSQNYQTSHKPWYSDMIRIYVICWPFMSSLTLSNTQTQLWETTVFLKSTSLEKPVWISHGGLLKYALLWFGLVLV